VRIYLIGPCDSPRSAGLHAALDSYDTHEVVCVDAVYFSEPPLGFSSRRSTAFNARVLSLGELGCAQAHMNAYRRIADGPDEWACVLEDDAVISDSEGFAEILESIPQLPVAESGTVVSLYTGSAAVAPNSQRPHLWTCLSEPTMAVAYCLDRRAAAALLEANADHSFAADWPRGSGVHFFLTRSVPVAHEDGFTTSIIGKRRADQMARGRLATTLAVARRMARSTVVYLGADYLVYRREYRSLADYRIRVLAPRLWWRTMRLVGSPTEYPNGGVYDVSRLQRLPFGPWRRR
jgi:hypothetical protein